MTAPIDSQEFESYVPVYDVIPEKWEDARAGITEQLRKITNSLNAKEIGFYLDQELLSGKAFIPGVNQTEGGGSSQQFRTILRKVIDASPLTAGANVIAHGITVDDNFTLIDMWCTASNSTTLVGQIITGSDVTYDSTNITVTSPGSFDRAFIICEYMLEV